MNTILAFTNNSSIKKHWNNVIPKEFDSIFFEDMDVLVKHLENNLENILMLDESSFENTAAILNELKKFTQTKVMLFHNTLDVKHVVSLLVYKIKAYENCYLNSDTLKNVITSVSSGNMWLQADITSFLISNYVNNKHVKNKEDIDIEIFTSKEREVLSFITLGLSNSEIAKELSISLSTVKGHIGHIFEKADIKDRLNLALKYKGYV